MTRPSPYYCDDLIQALHVDQQMPLSTIYTPAQWHLQQLWNTAPYQNSAFQAFEPRSPGLRCMSPMADCQPLQFDSAVYPPRVAAFDIADLEQDMFRSYSSQHMSFRHPSPEGTMTDMFNDRFDSYSRRSSDNSSPSPTVDSPDFHWSPFDRATPRLSSCVESSYGGMQGGVALRDIEASTEGVVDQFPGDSSHLDLRFDAYVPDHDHSCTHSDQHGSATTEASSSDFVSSTASTGSRSSVMPEDDESEYEPTQRKGQRPAAPKPRLSKVEKRYKGTAATRKPDQDRKSLVKMIGKNEMSGTHSTPTEKMKPYSCPLYPYGCQLIFTSKNEWKRHVVSQHLSAGYYRCDQCDDQNRGPNDFNRKDLFIQHLRRMHAPSKGPKQKGQATAGISPETEEFFEEVRERCYIQLHSRPLQMSCTFCPKDFAGEQGREAWIEHVGKHLTSSAKDATRQEDIPEPRWEADALLHTWLVDDGLIAEEGVPGNWQLVSAAALLKRRNRALERKNGDASPQVEDADGDVDV